MAQPRRDVAISLSLGYTGTRRESVATLRVHRLDGTWGPRGARVKSSTRRTFPGRPRATSEPAQPPFQDWFRSRIC